MLYTGESGNVHVQMKPRTQSHLSTLGMDVPQDEEFADGNLSHTDLTNAYMIF